MWRQASGGTIRIASGPFALRRPFLCAGVGVFGGRGSKTRHRGPFSLAKTNRKRTLASCRLPLAFNLPCRGSSCLIWPLPCVFKNEENARTIRSKSSQASGRRAKTPHVRFVLCFTARTGLRAQNPRVFIGFREAVPGPPKRPPKRLPGAKTPKPPSQAPPRGRSPPARPPQEAAGAFAIVFYRAKWPQVLKT